MTPQAFKDLLDAFVPIGQNYIDNLLPNYTTEDPEYYNYPIEISEYPALSAFNIVYASIANTDVLDSEGNPMLHLNFNSDNITRSFLFISFTPST